MEIHSNITLNICLNSEQLIHYSKTRGSLRIHANSERHMRSRSAAGDG